jgi:hypothetical protein
MFVQCLSGVPSALVTLNRLNEQLPAQFAGPTIEDTDDIGNGLVVKISGSDASHVSTSSSVTTLGAGSKACATT